MKRIICFLIPILLTLVGWEFVSQGGVVSRVLFPPPSKVFLAMWLMLKNGVLILDIGVSLWRLLVGALIGSSLGIGVGLLTGRIKFISRLLSPIILILRPLPAVAIIPLVIVWFGIDNPAKIFAISFAVFFLVWINAHMGVQQIPRVFLWSAGLLTKSQIKIFRQLIIPASMPFILVGMRIGLAVAFINLFVSELVGSSSGLGYRIAITHAAYRIDQMIAAMIVLGALGGILDQLLVWLMHKIFPWLKLSSK